MPRHWKGRPANGCSGCGQGFTSTSLFDAHRVGRQEYTCEQGLELDPPREDGRRCLDSEEASGLLPGSPGFVKRPPQGNYRLAETVEIPRISATSLMRTMSST
jgi:hypothetical protein